MNKARIGWVSRVTGASGEGRKVLDVETARRGVERGNQRYPDILYYLIEADAITTAVAVGLVSPTGGAGGK